MACTDTLFGKVKGAEMPVPSSLDNVADHLVGLLQNLIDRQGYDSFTKGLYHAVSTLHRRLFDNYGRWLRHLKLDGSLQLEDHLTHASSAHVQFGSLSQSNTWAFIGPWEFDTIEQERAWGCTAQLHQIVLWFLIHGEAANLRFLPECLCFIFFCASNALALEPADPRDSSSSNELGGDSSDDGESFPRRSSSELRDGFGGGDSFGRADGGLSAEDYSQVSFVLRSAGTDQMPYARGDFLESVVAPIYTFLAAEIKGKAEQRIKDRVMYDDVNEFFWSREAIEELLPVGDFTDKQVPKSLPHMASP
eukprot:639598-Prymnesium_polylepis.1